MDHSGFAGYGDVARVLRVWCGASFWRCLELKMEPERCGVVCRRRRLATYAKKKITDKEKAGKTWPKHWAAYELVGKLLELPWRF